MSSSTPHKLRVLFVDDEAPIRDVMEIELPPGTEYVITTPWELDIEGGVVKSALHEELQPQ